MAGVRLYSKEERDLRDGIAIASLLVMMFRTGYPQPYNDPLDICDKEYLSMQAYALADAMLEARDDKKAAQ